MKQVVSFLKKKNGREEGKTERGREGGIERKRHTHCPQLLNVFCLQHQGTEAHTGAIIKRNQSAGLYTPGVLYIKSTACLGVPKNNRPLSASWVPCYVVGRN